MAEVARRNGSPEPSVGTELTVPSSNYEQGKTILHQKSYDHACDQRNCHNVFPGDFRTEVKKKKKKRRRPPLFHILGKTHSNFKAETPSQCNTDNADVLFRVDPVKQSLLPETTSTKTMCSVVFTFLTYCLNFRRRGYVAETE